MKKRLAAALVMLTMLFSSASAQTLPGVEVFSPGLVRVGELLARGETVRMDAQIGVTDMRYARDLSVLSAMLSGTTFAYEGVGGVARGADTLRIAREGEELFSASLVRDGQRGQLTVNDRAFALDLSANQAAAGALDSMAGAAILERVPLERVCAWFEQLTAGQTLLAGFAVTQPFSVERTMSDDGARLTRIDISGEIARAGEAPYQVSGFLRQPGGRSPKDTFAIVLTQDEDNFFELDYSALRESKITRKNKAGEMEVDTTLKAAGRIAGSSFSSRLRVITRNAWTADGENLRERVSVSATLGHTDNTPGRRMQRLNDLSVKLRTVLSLETAETGNDVIAMDGETTLSAVFDGNTYLDLAIDAASQVGGAGQAPAVTAGAPAQTQEVAAALQEAAVLLMQRLYPQLGEKNVEKIGAGL